MDSRLEQILGAIIREYTCNAEPVSSQLLCGKYDLGISPATIRSVMTILEKEGYLEQPHTSAGRIPTGKAYRYFVDNLGEARGKILSTKETEYIDGKMESSKKEPREKAKCVAEVISEMSDNLAIGGVVDTGEFYKIGMSSLFDMPEFHEYERARRIVAIMEEFDRQFDRILSRFLDGEIEILIGRENPIRRIQDETVIATRFPLPGGYHGAAFMIGPIRMQYEKNIALMRYISQKMNDQVI